MRKAVSSSKFHRKICSSFAENIRYRFYLNDYEVHAAFDYLGNPCIMVLTGLKVFPDIKDMICRNGFRCSNENKFYALFYWGNYEQLTIKETEQDKT